MFTAQLAFFSFFNGMSGVLDEGTFGGYIAWGPLTFFDGFSDSDAPVGAGRREWRRRQSWHRNAT